MTFDRWLQEATGSFPRGVRERLAQEYGAHLEDSVAAGGSGDALELFGGPGALKRQLKKLYVSQERMDQVRKSEGRIRWLWGMALFLILFNLHSVIEFFGTRFFTHFLINFAVVAVPFLLLWGSTYRWKKARRASFQMSVFSVALSVSSLYGLIFDSPEQSYVVTGLTLFPIMMSGFIYAIIEDRRVERTLKIEETEHSAG